MRTMKTLVAVVAVACLWAVGRAATLELAIDIPAQPIEKALNAFAQQTGLQLLFRADAVGQGVVAPRVVGKFTAEEALGRLLANTSLSYKFLDERTVAIRSGKPVAGTGTETTERMRLAQLKQASPAAQESSEEGKKEELQEVQVDIPEILIRGSKSLNVDIVRTEDGPMPYVVFDSKEIEKSGATNLEDFFRKRLPMNTQMGAANQPSQTASSAGSPGDQSNISKINLRGLGAEQTLILIDGRRAPRLIGSTSNPGSASGRIFTQADINGIPLSAIERIEVLPSTAGGIYGGGAVGGVINIIRKRDYRGLDVRTGYDGAFRGGGETFLAEISGGFSPDHGATQISFSASHSASQPLYAGDNDLWRRARDRYFSIPSNTTNPTIPLGYVSNIQSAPAVVFVPVGTPGASCPLPTLCFVRQSPNLVLDNGTPLNSSFTSVPVGYSGVSSDGSVALAANAGHLNVDLSDDGSGRFAVLRNGPRVRSGDFNVRRTMGSRIDSFVDFSMSENLGRSFSTPQTTASLLANDVNNPFRQNILVSVPMPGIQTPVISRALNLAATAGVIVKFGGDWVATGEYDWSQARARTEYTANPLNTTVSSAFSNGALNPIRDVNAYPLNYGPFLLPSPDNIVGPLVTEQRLASARASGSLLEIASGRIDMTALVEHRDELARENRSSTVFSGTEFTTVNPGRRQSVDSGYAEVRLPLVSQRNARPFLQAFELQGSLRHDRYATRVASPASYTTAVPPPVSYHTNRVRSTDFTVALRWEPVRDVTLRASSSTGFLPPNIGQLVSSPFTVNSNSILRDPKRGNTLVPTPYTSVSGGNSNLQPEDSKSLSLGAVLTPHFLPGFRFSADYSRIRKSSEIGAAPGDIAILEQYFPDRVMRAPLTSVDMALGYTGGAITTLDISLINVAHSSLQAWDFQADYSFETRHRGSFRVYAIATHQSEFLRQLLPTTAPVDSAGFFDGPLEWRGNAGIDWSMGNWDIGWNSQYYDDYSVRSANAAAGTNDILVAAQGAERIPSRIYHDLNVSYRFVNNGAGLLKGLQLAAGIQNIFDKLPPALSGTSPVFTYSAYGDPRLRRYTLTASKNFGGSR